MVHKTNQDGNNRVAIYVRVSTLHQIDKDSLPMQKQDLIAYAKLMLNTDDYVIFEDAGYSGKNTSRPKFQEMMSQIRSGMFTHLLVWKIDRISRNLLDFASMYSELKQLGVVFVSKNEQFDTSTAMGEAMLKIILVFAELERNMTAERVTSTMISRAGNGQWNGGRVPFGYIWDKDNEQFLIHPEESSIVSFIHDNYEIEKSLIRVTHLLNHNNLYTRAGNPWNPVSVGLILRNIFYTGYYRYNVNKDGNRQKPKKESEWITIPDHHPAIVATEQKERILSILESNKRLLKERNIYATTKHTHIFAGILICGNCGNRMHATPSNAKKDWQYSNYTCHSKRKSNTGLGCKFTSDPVVGEFVFNYILNILNAKKTFSSELSIGDLQNKLLTGDTFKNISHIEPEGLLELFDVLSSGSVQKDIYGKNIIVSSSHGGSESELARLRKEKVKLERAMSRLRDLYLYSEDAMSESEYIIQRTKLKESLEDIDEQICIMNAEPWEQSLSDAEFIQRASEFIIAQKFTDRKYINFKRLAISVDREVLKSFVQNVIDNIVMESGKVTKIVFKNGLSHTFIYKQQ